MTNLEVFHKNRPIELNLPGNPNPLYLDLISFELFNEDSIFNKFYFIKLKPINLDEFDFFSVKILTFYINQKLKKYLKLFYINESFFFELID